MLVDLIFFLLGFLSIIALLYFVFGLFIVQVDGDSMYPEFHHGDIVIISFKHELKSDELKVGDVYIYESPVDSKMVLKRLTFLQGSQCFFEGDNYKESYDSRHYGFVNAERIIAKVLWHRKH